MAVSKIKATFTSNIEKGCQKPLTTADKFLIRTLVVKKFKLNVEYLSPNQLKFYRVNKEACL